MKNIWPIFKIHESVYILILLALISGYIKNALIILLIVFWHELGHIWLCKLFKYKIVNVTFYPFGGITKVDKLINSSINQELIVVLGGVINQVILGGIFYGLWHLDLINSRTLELFNYYNKNILIFNLLPIIPLDGSLLIRLILEKYLSYRVSYYSYLLIGLISGIGFIIGSKKILINNLLVVGFLGFKIWEAFKDYPFIYHKFLLERYLYNLNYKKIKYKDNFNKLGKEKYYFFKIDDKIVSEKKMLAKVFDRKL